MGRSEERGGVVAWYGNESEDGKVMRLWMEWVCIGT
jgi:hypothetical protein